MNYSNRITLSDRVSIEAGIYAGHTLEKIAEKINKHPASISREIRNNRTLLQGERPRGKDCIFAAECKIWGLCQKEDCKKKCASCHEIDCRIICNHYNNSPCKKLSQAPYVCNICPQRRKCRADRAYYLANQANASAERRRSESRSKIHTRGEQLEKLDSIVTPLILKGQPLTHIFTEHGEEIGVSQRTLYNYIDSGVLSIRNFDLRRKVGYRPRKKKKRESEAFLNQQYRKSRTYDDLQKYIEKHPDVPIVEMDTVKGVREQGKRMLTMIFCDLNLMLIFLMRDGKAETVVEVFDWLTSLVGIEVFKKLFPVILTDNGSEFKYTDELEKAVGGEKRTRIYYCDPQASWQKPHIEKNHEYIRYVIPQGKSFNPYTQEDMVLLTNHINSTRRSKLDNSAPYELVNNEDLKLLMELLGLHLISPDEVNLKPGLLKRQ